jgi:cell pole-organizing protein PopZ
MPEPPRPIAAPEPEPIMNQADIDAMIGGGEPMDKGLAEPAPPDILELTEAMAAEAEPVPEFRRIDASSDVVFSDEEEEPPASAPPPAEALLRHFSGEPVASALLSETTTRAVDSAFNTLAHTVLVQNARTLEDLVREMLRPMLKSWLDDNLPGLVERLVRAEIERVSRGRS